MMFCECAIDRSDSKSTSQQLAGASRPRAAGLQALIMTHVTRDGCSQNVNGEVQLHELMCDVLYIAALPRAQKCPFGG